MHEVDRNIAEVLAPAKLNLWLYVGSRQVDGYHPISSLMDRVTLADTLQARRTPGGGIHLAVGGMGDADPRDNLVTAAAQALEREAGIRLDVEIDLSKKVPVAAGLGGGSSDAAAILRLLVFLFGLDIQETKLMEIACSLGADVPFFLTGGPQLAEGRGEIMQTASLGFDYAAVIVNPGTKLPTAGIYRLYDKSIGVSQEKFTEYMEKARGDIGRLDSIEVLIELLHNDLESAAKTLCPEIRDIERDLQVSGAAGVLVSGSGPSVFGIFGDIEAASRAASGLKKKYPLTWAVTPVRNAT